MRPKKLYTRRVADHFRKVMSEEGVKLVDALLALDPKQRPSAVEVLKHPYFTEELPRACDISE